ncbi:MAG TPA: CrcB family protein [Mycobacteriales bacterium]|jgi:CrcB protein|nr:CrcB family protein [Mycobacteriales bacterium]
MTERQPTEFPTDSDIDLAEPAQRRELPDAPWSVLAAISIGGGLGALTRWGLTLAMPHGPDQMPWPTLLTNLGGCAAIGVLMVIVHETIPRHPLLRPFVGVGILGGFTTFSTYVVDAGQLVARREVGLALGYTLGTLAGALAATWLGLACARWVFRTRDAQ